MLFNSIAGSSRQSSN